jgi:hypothetical protein
MVSGTSVVICNSLVRQTLPGLTNLECANMPGLLT